MSNIINDKKWYDDYIKLTNKLKNDEIVLCPKTNLKLPKMLKKIRTITIGGVDFQVEISNHKLAEIEAIKYNIENDIKHKIIIEKLKKNE